MLVSLQPQAGVETATEKWGGGGGRDFFVPYSVREARHLGGLGACPLGNFWILGSIRSNLVQSEEVLC